MADVIINEMPVDLSDVWPRVVAGADWKTSLYVYLNDRKDPQNTTGWSAEVAIKDLQGATLKTLTVGSGIVNNTAAGRFDVTYAAADTGALKVQRVHITVKYTDNGGGVTYPFVADLDVFYP